MAPKQFITFNKQATLIIPSTWQKYLFCQAGQESSPTNLSMDSYSVAIESNTPSPLET